MVAMGDGSKSSKSRVFGEWKIEKMEMVKSNTAKFRWAVQSRRQSKQTLHENAETSIQKLNDNAEIAELLVKN